MSGPGFAQNPIGVEYDPADWLAQLRAGRPEAEFYERTVHLPLPAGPGRRNPK
jgi:hypothetical protein